MSRRIDDQKIRVSPGQAHERTFGSVVQVICGSLTVPK